MGNCQHFLFPIWGFLGIALRTQRLVAKTRLTLYLVVADKTKKVTHAIMLSLCDSLILSV